MAQQKGDLCLIGKIWVDRAIGRSIIEGIMSKIWKLSVKATFRELGQNVFLLSFATHANKQWVVSRRMWLFDNNLFALEEYDGFTKLQNMRFTNASMWVQLHDLPMASMNKKCGEKIGKTLGKVEVDVDEDDIGWGTSLHVKIK